MPQNSWRQLVPIEQYNQRETLYLSLIFRQESGNNYRFDEENDGYELVIFDVSNLKIIGLGLKSVKITKPVYGDVLVFETYETTNND